MLSRALKFRAGTEKMWRSFFLATTLITLSTERGMFYRIDSIWLCADMSTQEGSESLLSSKKQQGNLCSLQLHWGLILRNNNNSWTIAPWCWTVVGPVNTVLQSLSASKRFIEIDCCKICLLELTGGEKVIFYHLSSEWGFNAKLEWAIFVGAREYWSSIGEAIFLNKLVSHFVKKTTNMTFHFDKNYFLGTSS